MNKRLSFVSAVLGLSLLAARCGSESKPQQPNSAQRTQGPRITWDQAVSDRDDIALYRFGAYINSERYALPDAVCSKPRNGVASCEAMLPPLTPGKYKVAVVSYRIPDYVDSPPAPAFDLVIDK
jgi:hypothetical protein